MSKTLAFIYVKYIFIFLLFFIFSTSVSAEITRNIFNTAENIDITSKDSKILDDFLDENNKDGELSGAEIYFDHSGKVFGMISKDNFGIIFDNDESLIVSLKPIKDKTSSEIKRIIISDKEKYSEELCIEKYKRCEYTEEGYVEARKQKIGFFQRIKNFFSSIPSFFFPRRVDEGDDGINGVFKLMSSQEKEKLEGDVWKDFFDYRENKGKEGYGEEKSLKIRKDLSKLIANADSIRDIMHLRSLVDQYCSVEYGEKSYQNNECRKLVTELKKKGDKLKEKLFKEIDEESKDALIKLIQLRSILMAQEKASKGTSFASGETDVWFSAENVAKIKEAIGEKAKKWWRKHLREDYSVENIWKWRLLALAYDTSSSDVNNSGSLFGNYGDRLMEDVKKQAAAAVLMSLNDIDVCNPDLKKLRRLMEDLIYKDSGGRPIFKDSCRLVLPETACNALEKGDLQAVYSILFYSAGFDKNNSESLPIPPIECDKFTSLIITDTKEEIEVEHDLDYTHTDPDTGLNTERSYSDNIDAEIKESELDNIISTEEINIDTEIEGDDFDSVCTLIIFDDEVVGWDYYTEDCNKNNEEGLFCWDICGEVPPLIIKDVELNECYETVGGYINEDLIIPCYHRPMPSSGAKDCVEACLME